MNSPHRIRRQARRMRRYGMQPMVVINSGDALPDLIIVTLCRWLWRYRSELAPVNLATLIATKASRVVWAARGRPVSRLKPEMPTSARGALATTAPSVSRMTMSRMRSAMRPFAFQSPSVRLGPA